MISLARLGGSLKTGRDNWENFSTGEDVLT